MGGSRRTESDRARIARTIINPDVIVTEAEKRRCLEAVEAYNLQIECWKESDPSPSMGVACMAGFGWMEVWCGGCRTVVSIDLAGLHAHPLTRVYDIAKRLSCTRCYGQGPTPQIRGLRRHRPETIAERRDRLRREELERQRDT